MLSVLKIGGSVLRGSASFSQVAEALARRLLESDAERLVVIVSAEHGITDALLTEAQAIASAPDAEALDLLWSTGELRSVSLLTLHLQKAGIEAIPFNVHQAGLFTDGPGAPAGTVVVRPLRLLAALGRARIVVVPGFLAAGAGGAIASLGRGGSDLTAVLLASALRADRCELIKDVAGYYTADPNVTRDAEPIRQLSFTDAVEMADAGCDLVQRGALETARARRLPIVVRALNPNSASTVVVPDDTVVQQPQRPTSNAHTLA